MCQFQGITSVGTFDSMRLSCSANLFEIIPFELAAMEYTDPQK